jgi:hypothetical protein
MLAANHLGYAARPKMFAAESLGLAEQSRKPVSGSSILAAKLSRFAA